MATVINGQNVYQLTSTGDGKPQDIEKSRAETNFPPPDGTAHLKSPDNEIIAVHPVKGTP